MNQKRHSIGENDVPLDLWPDELDHAEKLVDTSTPYINQHGALEGLIDGPLGASVSLGERALALVDIMDYYNQANKTRGANLSSGDLERRYGARGAHEITTNMTAKTNVMSRAARRAFDTLTAESQMVEAGFDADDMLLARRQLERTITSQYGPGRAYARDRQKFVRRAEKVANLKPKK